MTTDSAISALEQAQQAFDAASAQAASVQPWSQELVKFLAMSVLGFSGLVLVLSAALLWRAAASPPGPATPIFRAFSPAWLPA